MNDRAFSFLRVNEREAKPRTLGLTEIRDPYYTPMGKRYLEDVLETMSEYVDSLKFAGGSFTLMPRPILKEIIETAHHYTVLVSTGGFIEHVLAQEPDAVPRYIQECSNVGFDILEISSGFITIPVDDWLRLVDQVQKSGDVVECPWHGSRFHLCDGRVLTTPATVNAPRYDVRVRNRQVEVKRVGAT